MKILIITETLFEGGAELFILRLSRGLLAAGEEVKVVCLNKEYENKEMTKHYADINFIRLSLPFLHLIEFTDKLIRKLNIDFSIKYYLQGKQLKKIVKDIDIIHTHYLQVDYLVSKLKRNYSFKHIVTVHGDYSAQYDSFKKGELRFWLNLDQKMRKVAASVDQWVVISEEQRLFFRNIMKVSAKEITKIYNGFTPISGLPEKLEKGKEFVMGMVARGTPQKGWQILIEAFLTMPVDTKLILVGGSEYLDQLKIKYSNNPRIIFTGFQSDVFKWMNQMDVFVLPTLYPYESLPNVIVEALYVGLPVIATNVGEIEKMITDEKSGDKAGFVIDFDGKNINEIQLFDKLKFLYDNPLQRHELSKTAKNAFNKFNMEKCVNAYRNVYPSL